MDGEEEGREPASGKAEAFENAPEQEGVGGVEEDVDDVVSRRV
jgi:hypothetical protein